jgi:hypothetical protein
LSMHTVCLRIRARSVLVGAKKGVGINLRCDWAIRDSRRRHQRYLPNRRHSASMRRAMGNNATRPAHYTLVLGPPDVFVDHTLNCWRLPTPAGRWELGMQDGYNNECNHRHHQSRACRTMHDARAGI